MHFEWQSDQAIYCLKGIVGTVCPSIKATLAIQYHDRHHPRTIQGKDWTAASVSTTTRVDPFQGSLQQVSLTGKSNDQILEYHFDFALAENHPLFLCHCSLTNVGDHPVSIDRIIFCQTSTAGIDLISGQDGKLAFFSNGWQSWSYTGVYGPGQRQHRSHLGLFRQPLLDNAGTPRPTRPGHYGSDFFGILGDRAHRTGLLAGFLSQKQQFGTLEAFTGSNPSIILWANGDSTRLEPGASLKTDPATISFIDLDQVDPLADYLEAVARQHDLRPTLNPTTSWCSWYYYYNHITQEDIRQNLKACIQYQDILPLRLVQIDDGFEKKIGDWYSFQPGFPQGVATLAGEIKATGLTAGVWLAPFLVNPRAQLARDHPDFILRNLGGFSVTSGATSESWINFALDLSYPPALEYACQVISKAAHEWGFPYLKLDFLSAGALPGRRFDPTRSRAQILRTALESLRLAAGEETYLVGCGSPLGSSIGIFDSVRIGEDVSPAWEPEVPVLRQFFRNEVEFPATRNAIHNILTRAPLSKRWWLNDPDCLLIRSESKLTQAEVQSLSTAIILSGGSLVFSDDLSRLSKERLKLAATFVPPIGQRPFVLDWFDTDHPACVRLDLDGPVGPWHLLAYFNWSEQPRRDVLDLATFKLPLDKLYWVRSFWDQSTSLVRDGVYAPRNLAPHGVALLAARPALDGRPQYLGSDLHVSQGMEVAGWEVSHHRITLTLTLPRTATGQVELSLPSIPVRIIRISQDGKENIPWKALGDGRYLIEVSFEKVCTLDIEW